jgi:hypothetical protein
VYYTLRGPPPFVENSKNKGLYTRNPACKGVLFVNVGYSAHTLRPFYQPFFDSLAATSDDGATTPSSGWCVATFDWAGCGYSEGTRCLVEPAGMLLDLRQFVELVLGSSNVTAAEGGEQQQNQLPWYVVGQSMAGCVALLFSQHAGRTKAIAESAAAAAVASGDKIKTKKKKKSSDTDDSQKNIACYRGFKGCVAVAPLVTLSLPPTPILALLNCIAKVFPLRALPSFLGSDLPDEVND